MALGHGVKTHYITGKICRKSAKNVIYSFAEDTERENTDMKKRNVISLLLAAVMVALSLGGCASSGNRGEIVSKNDKEQVNITFFGNKADESNIHVIEKILRNFMKENPNIIITYEAIKGTEYYDTLLKRMGSGNGDDIFVVDHDSVLTLQAEGHLADLSDLPAIGQYSDAEKQQFTTETGIFWLPTTVSAFGLYGNMDLLQAYGRDVPANLDELRSVCEAFLSKGITPIIANNDISLKTLAIGASYYSAYQSDTEDRLYSELNAGTVQLGDSLADGLALAEELIQKGYVDAGDTLETKKTSDDLEIFAKGEHPFLLTGAWAANRLKTDFHAAFAYEVHPLPILENGSMVVVNPDVRLAVNQNSRHLEEAKRFVAYFTQADNLQMFCEDQCSISPLKDGPSCSAKELQPVVSGYQAGHVAVGADFRLNIPIWEYSKDAVQGLLQGETLSSVQNTLNRRANDYIGEGLAS